MYYQIESDEHTMTAYLARENHSSRSLIRGAFIDPAKEDLPYRVTYEDPRDNPLFDYYSGDNVMSKRMAEVLKKAGADNFQEFATQMKNKRTGEVSDDFITFNILGLVSCARLDASNTTELGSSYYFHDLVIDPAKVGDQLLFRLAESKINVLVHARVAEALKAANLRGLVLSPVEQKPPG
ncbi:MAG TPA: DUF1629 domain-containing protein [Steroidobacteraceae bacterium]|nr:DUF1629 domain-containing protein [Steroidobacteraceae bacterium]